LQDSPKAGRVLEKGCSRLGAKPAFLDFSQASDLVGARHINLSSVLTEKPLRDAISFLEQAVRLDPKFTLAYCASEEAQDLLYSWYDPTRERRASADAAINTALRLQIDLPEVHLAYALVLDLATELSIWS